MGNSYTTFITLLAVFITFYFSLKVGSLRGKIGVNAPNCDGGDDFNRAFRVHMNTIEQIVLFLPSLWLALPVLGDLYAASAGAVWVIGRLLYSIQYMRDPNSRTLGMVLTFLPTVVLWGAAMWDVIQRLS